MCTPKETFEKKNGGCTGWLNVQNVWKTHKKSPKRKITDSRQQQINIFSPNWPLLQHTEQTRILIDFLLTRRFFSHHHSWIHFGPKSSPLAAEIHFAENMLNRSARHNVNESDTSWAIPLYQKKITCKHVDACNKICTNWTIIDLKIFFWSIFGDILENQLKYAFFWNYFPWI